MTTRPKAWRSRQHFSIFGGTFSSRPGLMMSSHGWALGIHGCKPRLVMLYNHLEEDIYGATAPVAMGVVRAYPRASREHSDCQRKGTGFRIGFFVLTLRCRPKHLLPPPSFESGSGDRRRKGRATLAPFRLYSLTFDHCCSRRFAETGIDVPNFWAKSETRYSSSIQRYWINSGSASQCGPCCSIQSR